MASTITDAQLHKLAVFLQDQIGMEDAYDPVSVFEVALRFVAGKSLSPTDAETIRAAIGEAGPDGAMSLVAENAKLRKALLASEDEAAVLTGLVRTWRQLSEEAGDASLVRHIDSSLPKKAA